MMIALIILIESKISKYWIWYMGFDWIYFVLFCVYLGFLVSFL